MTTTSGHPFVVSPEWLLERLGEPGIRVVDVSISMTPPSRQGEPWGAEPARDAYRAGHVPGAGFVDMVTELSDASSPLPYTLPHAEQVDAVLERLGIDDETHVVLYDGQMSSFASRAWLVLRHFGFDRASVLDGGIVAWRAIGGPLETGEPTFARGTARARARAGVTCGTDRVQRAVERGDAQLVNALARSQWDGTDISSYARVGQIPGSVEAVAARLVDPATGRFVPLEQARALFAEAGVDLGAPVVVYCGGGVSAAKSALALTRLGAGDVEVYDGSLSEWTADPRLPLDRPAPIGEGGGT